ncbi:MAG TPA: Ig-like domain-containing protein [Planctomycetota bacterium]|jgi:hypothetical protein
MKTFILIASALLFVCTCDSAHAADFADTGSLGNGRWSHTATLLPSGQVLAAGGSTLRFSEFPDARNSCERYDPASTFWLGAAQLLTPRTLHTATLLVDGRVLVAGGQGYDYSNPTLPSAVALAQCEIYDPVANAWTATQALLQSRVSHKAARLPNGNVLVVGGSALATCEIFRPDSGTWANASSMHFARSGHTLTPLANGRILVAGGESSQSSEIYDPALDSWSLTGAMNVARSNHAAVLLNDGRVLVVGGNGTATSEIYDPVTGTWSLTASMSQPRTLPTATLLPDRNVLVVGGTSDDTAEVFIAQAGSWQTPVHTGIVRNSHTATLLGDGRVLIAGGMGGPGGNGLQSCQFYLPNHPPVADSQSIDLTIGSFAIPVTVTLTGSDPDHDPITFAVVSPPQHGTLTGTAPTLFYTPDAGYSGDDSFAFVAQDAVSQSDPAKVSFHLHAPNLPPQANSQEINLTIGTFDVPVAVSLTASDPDGDPLKFVVLSLPQHGTLTGTTPALFYTPDDGYVGEDSFTFAAQDAVSQSDPGTITFHLAAAPVIEMLTTGLSATAGKPLGFGVALVSAAAEVTYAWDFGDGDSVVFGPSQQKVFAQPGSYQVTLTATDSSGAATTLTRVIQVLSEQNTRRLRPSLSYNASWKQDGAGHLRMQAVVPTGAHRLAAGSTLSLQIAGARYSGVLDANLQASSADGVSFRARPSRHADINAFEIRVRVFTQDLGAKLSLPPAAVHAQTLTVTVQLQLDVLASDVQTTAVYRASPGHHLRLHGISSQ